ncbi:NAD(P)-dependent alcohol dehydrogenase [Patulibacter sp. S7RM1-6]
MAAVRFHRYGPPEVLVVDRVPRPGAGIGQVLVRVAASSVNGADLSLRAGKLQLLTGRRFPKRTGIDFTGEVVAVGEGITNVAVGERVWGVTPRSRTESLAEYVAVAAGRVAPAPTTVDLVEAAALPGVGTTAITALRDVARLRDGERLLVRGAGGGVGMPAVQLGHAMGVHVTGLAGARNLDLVREQGADVALDYRTTAPEDLGRFDVVLDTVGSDLTTFRRLLAPTGRMVAIAPDVDALGRSLATILVSTVHGRRRIRFFSGNPDRSLLADLTARVDAGQMRPVIDTVHPLADVAQAHRAMEAGGSRGKHVVRVA